MKMEDPDFAPGPAGGGFITARRPDGRSASPLWQRSFDLLEQAAEQLAHAACGVLNPLDHAACDVLGPLDHAAYDVPNRACSPGRSFDG